MNLKQACIQYLGPEIDYDYGITQSQFDGPIMVESSGALVIWWETTYVRSSFEIHPKVVLFRLMYQRNEYGY